MKALSIRQPWAWLIAHGIKPVENRSWRTAVRGDILIHAGQQFDQQGLDGVLAIFGDLRTRLPQQYDLGGIVGMATLVDCVDSHPSAWFTGPHGLVLHNPRPLPFRPWRGELGFFDVPDSADLAQALHAASPQQAEAEAGQERLF